MLRTSLLTIVTLGAIAASLLAQGSAPSSAQNEPKDAASRTFQIKAPKAQEVTVRGQWTKDPIPMKKDDEGVWKAEVSSIPSGVWEYSFSVDGLNVVDPQNPLLKPQRSPQKSILHIPSNPPALWDWQDVPHGTVHQHAFWSKSLNSLRDVWVYTPPGYETADDRKYPLLVLQHGSGDNHAAWVMHGKAHWIADNLIAKNNAVPMVIVMLDGHPRGSVRWGEAGNRSSAMEAFTRELKEDALPLVDSLYRVEKGPDKRAIAGLSMGGGQSLTVGFTNVNLFAWIGAFSSAPPEQSITDAFLGNPEAANNRLRLLWIACGKGDFLLERNQTLINALKEKGIRHEWNLTDGDHSWPVWRIYLGDFLPKLFRD
jgi:enterochelin esterase-like enzyme